MIWNWISEIDGKYEIKYNTIIKPVDLAKATKPCKWELNVKELIAGLNILLEDG